MKLETVSFDALDYCVNDLNGQPFDPVYLQEHLREKGYNTVSVNVILGSVGRDFDAVLFTKRNIQLSGKDHSPSAPELKFILTQYAYHQYAELIELREARKSAKSARRLANISIWIAVAALVVNSVLGALPYFQEQETIPVKIERNPLHGGGL